MVQEITVTELLKLHQTGEIALIDVRSPSEFEDGTIPGSFNIPLFDDEERARVGTLYKQTSEESAKDEGLGIVSAKLPEFVKAIGRTPAEKKAVFCWRGGMRSKTSAALAALMGMQMYRLTGGFRAYRGWVVEALEQFRQLPPCYVLNGYTGVGKTDLLKQLQALGYPVIDLEGMAQHRGSIFGQIGKRPHNQKTFESLLVHELLRLKQAPYLIMEAESKRIGKVVLPDFLMEAKEKGMAIHLELPIEERVLHIIEDYLPSDNKQACIESFALIDSRIHTPIAAQIRQYLEQDQFDQAVELLLLYYYDPRYQHATEQYEQDRITIQASNRQQALQQLLQQLPPPVAVPAT